MFHFKNASGKSGVDIYLGGGAALIAARKTADNLGEIEKNRGAGQYAEHVSQGAIILATMPVYLLFYLSLRTENKI